MRDYIPRHLEAGLDEALRHFPVVALVGPRQCGKSTVARRIVDRHTDAVHLDLERPSDLRKLDDAEYYLSRLGDRLVCLDEIQRKPELFPLLRVLVDEDRRPGRFLVLGSASRDLLQQSSETLAGRIIYYELTPFLAGEVCPGVIDETGLWVRGGYPESILAESDNISMQWRQSFIQTYLERDLAQFGFSLPSTAVRRFWSMLAHTSGQTVNYSKLGQSLGVSHTTVRRWLDVLEATFMVRILPPYEGNIKKRLVKAPKIYVRDSGILHALLELPSHDAVLGHPVAGASWEGFALEQVMAEFRDCEAFFYRTHKGCELDLILQKGRRKAGVEFKLNAAPPIPRNPDGMIEELDLAGIAVAAPVRSPYSPKPKVFVENLSGICGRINKLLCPQEYT